MQLFEKCGTLIERYTDLIEKVSSFRVQGRQPVSRSDVGDSDANASATAAAAAADGPRHGFTRATTAEDAATAMDRGCDCLLLASDPYLPEELLRGLLPLMRPARPFAVFCTMLQVSIYILLSFNVLTCEQVCEQGDHEPCVTDDHFRMSLDAATSFGSGILAKRACRGECASF
eukprot:SAG31_NODE_7831_length_1587_cov_1.715726_1_plen_174_part_00